MSLVCVTIQPEVRKIVLCQPDITLPNNDSSEELIKVKSYESTGTRELQELNENQVYALHR